jgi:hypothetical protein
MINYRVDNLDEMIAQLRDDGVEIVGGPESHENGKFAWIMDPEGNKVELWEPMIWDERTRAPEDVLSGAPMIATKWLLGELLARSPRKG